MATWSIEKTNYVLEKDGFTNVINNLQWSLVASETVGENVYKASTRGAQKLAPPNADTYISYSQVTEAQCIAWLEESMGEQSIAVLEASLATRIELQKNPVNGAGTPWS